MKTLSQYKAYQSAVESNLKHLSFVSTGSCPGCSECGLDRDCSDLEREQAEEPGFSWTACEACGSNHSGDADRVVGGSRYPAHGRDKDSAILHLSVCVDCLYYLNYGKLDDLTMMEIEKQ